MAGKKVPVPVKVEPPAPVSALDVAAAAAEADLLADWRTFDFAGFRPANDRQRIAFDQIERHVRAIKQTVAADARLAARRG